MRKLLIFTLILFQSISFASADEIGKIFKETWTSGYTRSECFKNIVALLKRSHAANANIYNANLIHITNKGTTVFGMVNAEHARGNFSAQESNWYFHAILENNGMIYDFDFGQAPVITTKKQYFEKMFFSDIKGKGKFYVAPETKMNDYEVTILRGPELVDSNGKPGTGEKMKLRDYLTR